MGLASYQVALSRDYGSLFSWSLDNILQVIVTQQGNQFPPTPGIRWATNEPKFRSCVMDAFFYLQRI
jgi:hypothetical protein